jgi:hypothetical protein
MTAHCATDDLADVRELVEVALQGAKVNRRPDVVDRLTAAARRIAPTAVTEPVRASVACTVVEALQTLEIDLRTREAVLSDPGLPRRLLAELRHAERRLRQFEERSAEWPQTLNEGLSAASADLEFHIRSRSRGVLAEGIATIEAGRGADAQFDDWLRERLVAEASACYERLSVAVNVTAARIATRLNLPAPAPLTSLPLLAPEKLVAQSAARPPRTAMRSPLSGRLLGIVMPTYGGTMMTLVLPRFLGLVLPLWLVIGSGVTGAVTMGSAAMAAERQRQRSRRGGEDIASLRSAMEGFQLALSKQVRDAVQVLRQDLRRSVGVAVSRQSRMLSGEARAARTAAQDASRTADAVRDIRQDLAALHEFRHRALQIAQSDGLTMLPGRAQPQGS